MWRSRVWRTSEEAGDDSDDRDDLVCDVSEVCGENEDEGDEVGEEGQDEEGLRGIVLRVEVFTTCCESQAVASTCSMQWQ